MFGNNSVISYSHKRSLWVIASLFLQIIQLKSSHTHPTFPCTFQSNLQIPLSRSLSVASLRSPEFCLQPEVSSFLMAIFSFGKKQKSNTIKRIIYRIADLGDAILCQKPK